MTAQTPVPPLSYLSAEAIARILSLDRVLWRAHGHRIRRTRTGSAVMPADVRRSTERRALADYLASLPEMCVVELVGLAFLALGAGSACATAEEGWAQAMDLACDLALPNEIEQTLTSQYLPLRDRLLPALDRLANWPG